MSRRRLEDGNTFELAADKTWLAHGQPTLSRTDRARPAPGVSRPWGPPAKAERRTERRGGGRANFARDRRGRKVAEANEDFPGSAGGAPATLIRTSSSGIGIRQHDLGRGLPLLSPRETTARRRTSCLRLPRESGAGGDATSPCRGSQHKTAQSPQFICTSSAAAGARPTARSLSAADTNIIIVHTVA